MEVDKIELSLQLKERKPQIYGETDVSRRSDRIKNMSLLEEASKNKRVMKKRKKLELNSQKKVEKYYLNQKIKLTSSCLETIFEEPEQNLVFSRRKLVRSINFAKTTSKVKKRSINAKKVLKGGFKTLNKQLGLDMLMRKLEELDSEDDC